jgi:hypothetical protein
MIIKMLRDKMGSNDGFTTKLYKEGEVHEVSEALAEAFFAEKLAEPLAEKAAENQPEPYVEGQIYVEDGVVFIGAIPADQTDVALLPIDQLTDEERAELVKDGKITEDGQPVKLKAQTGAPKNKAITKAPKNKSQ